MSMLSGQAHKKSVMDLENNLLENFIHKPWSEDDLFNILRPTYFEKPSNYTHEKYFNTLSRSVCFFSYKIPPKTF